MASVSPPRTTTPACKSTQENLLANPSRDVAQDCPICEEEGYLVRIGFHPSAMASVSLPRSTTPTPADTPATACKSTQEVLIAQGHGLLEDCPLCKRRGYLVPTGSHPTAAQVAAAAASGSSGGGSSGSSGGSGTELSMMRYDCAVIECRAILENYAQEVQTAHGRQATCTFNAATSSRSKLLSHMEVCKCQNVYAKLAHAQGSNLKSGESAYKKLSDKVHSSTPRSYNNTHRIPGDLSFAEKRALYRLFKVYDDDKVMIVEPTGELRDPRPEEMNTPPPSPTSNSDSEDDQPKPKKAKKSHKKK